MSAWIALPSDLLVRPEICKLIALSGCPLDESLGRLLRFLLWASTQASATLGPGMTLDALANVCQVPIEFVRALMAAGLITETPDGLHIPWFDHWLSRGARRKLLSAQRVWRYRQRAAATAGDTAPDESHQPERYAERYTERYRERYSERYKCNAECNAECNARCNAECNAQCNAPLCGGGEVGDNDCNVGERKPGLDKDLRDDSRHNPICVSENATKNQSRRANIVTLSNTSINSEYVSTSQYLLPNDYCSEPNDRAPSPALTPTDHVVFTYPTVGQNSAWHLTESHLARLQERFPNIDVRSQCRMALAWLEANPGRRKTPRGMPRFLVNWLMRTVDRGNANTTRDRQTDWRSEYERRWLAKRQQNGNGSCSQ